jgi:hypothetical protein
MSDRRGGLNAKIAELAEKLNRFTGLCGRGDLSVDVSRRLLHLSIDVRRPRLMFRRRWFNAEGAEQ